MPRYRSSDRLLNAEAFAHVARCGTSVRTSAIKMASKQAHRRRLGLVASRRVGSAVVLNRLKRVSREHFRLHRERYPIADVVVIFFPNAAKLSNEQLRQHLERAAHSLASAMK